MVRHSLKSLWKVHTEKMWENAKTAKKSLKMVKNGLKSLWKVHTEKMWENAKTAKK